MEYLGSNRSLEEVLNMFDPFNAVTEGDNDDWRSMAWYCLRSVGFVVRTRTETL